MAEDGSYVEDRSPGQGWLGPRAWFGSNLPLIELNGPWRFRLAAGLSDLSGGFERREFDGDLMTVYAPVRANDE